jgi:two-component system, NarL family, response regulator DegU
MNKISIIIADDHPLFLKGLKDTLIEEEDFEVLATASNGQEALDKAQLHKPNIVTLDLDMPVMNGIAASKLLLRDEPQCKIIILSMHKDADIIKAAMAIGIHGYVFKDDAVNELVNAIRTVHNGSKYVSSDFTENKISSNKADTGFAQLTKMEKIILKAIAEEKTTQQIAAENFISNKTVENHRANICRKLNLSGNNSLLKFAIKTMGSI